MNGWAERPPIHFGRTGAFVLDGMQVCWLAGVNPPHSIWRNRQVERVWQGEVSGESRQGQPGSHLGGFCAEESGTKRSASASNAEHD